MLFGHHSPDEQVKTERGRSYDHRSQPGTPALSRSSSVSSNVSTQSAPHWDNRDRSGSITSAGTTASTKSGFGSIFKKKEKKDKKDVEKLVLTSKHAASVKTKMMLDPKLATKKPVKTAGVVGTQNSKHLTAAQQEMRHPHCGPAQTHVLPDMPMLTRIASGDERDEEEDDDERRERQRWEWEESKIPGVTRIDEAHSTTVTPTDSPWASPINSPMVSRESSPTRRPLPRTKSSFGGRWRRDEHGNWTR